MLMLPAQYKRRIIIFALLVSFFTVITCGLEAAEPANAAGLNAGAEISVGGAVGYARAWKHGRAVSTEGSTSRRSRVKQAGRNKGASYQTYRS